MSSRTGLGSREDKSAENEQRDAPLGASRVFFVSAMQFLQGIHVLRLPISESMTLSHRAMC